MNKVVFKCVEHHILHIIRTDDAMAFPLPKPQAPQLPQHLLRTIDCQQGAVRAVRFNGTILNVIIIPRWLERWLRK